LLTDIEGIFKNVKEIICVLKCVRRKRTFRDMEGIFKKVNYIYVCVRAVRREKKNNFQRERSIRPGEGKQIQARKIS
jgi:hypothetical protein